MKKKNLLLHFVVLVTAMMCALGTSAAEAYACYTSSNTTLTFYYDNNRSTRTGTTYDLNTDFNFPAWYSDNTYVTVTKVVFVPSFAEANPTSTYAWFYNMTNLRSITGLNYLNTSEVTHTGWMFRNCDHLTSLDLSQFITAKVTDMNRMFMGCTGLTSLDLSRFNTSSVVNMRYLFTGCTSLRTIYVGVNWSTAAVVFYTDMFKNCTSLVGGQGTTFNSSHVGIDYAHIDGGTSNPGYFTRGTEAYACYTPSNTTLTFYYDNQRGYRSGTTYDLNAGSTDTGWDTDDTKSNVTKVVFAPSFAGARPTTTYGWFYAMTNLQSITGLNYLNTSEVTNMAWMFTNCTKLTSVDVSHFNTSKVTSMSATFGTCWGLTSLDLTNFNTSQVTDMELMFYDSTNLRTIYVGDGWSTATVTYSSDMFYNCTSLVGGQGTAYSSSNPRNKTYAHIDGGPSNPGYFTDKNPTEAYVCYTPSNTTLTFYFDKLRSSRTGTTYDLNTSGHMPDWYTDGTNAYVTKAVFDPSFADARPTTTHAWFYCMTNLQSITGMNYLNTSKVTNMAWMFYGSTKLTSLDLSHFNTSKVTSMRYMFDGCTRLQTIYVGSGWSTAAVTFSENMFNGCSSLVGGQGTTYSSSNPKDKTYAHIDGGPSNPGYFTDKNVALRGDVNGDGSVSISDVTALIDYLLTGNASGINMSGADTNQDSSINISDVTVLIDYLLSGSW